MNNLVLLSSKYLHALIYFVADAPTKDNLSPTVPLVGTDSYKTLLKWIGDMNIDITRVRMYNQSDKPFDNVMSRVTLNKAVELEQIKVIALGQKASDYLTKAGIEEYFVLPHPSLRNRQLNNKEFIKEKLGACENYIYKGIKNEKKSEESPKEDIQPEQKLPSESQSD